MDCPPILPDPAALRLVCLEAGPEGIAVVAQAAARRAPCPECGTASGRVHSWYGRTAADLPWLGAPVRLRLRVRRFFCDAPACGRRVFTERLPGVLAPYARRTHRLSAWLTRVAFALGGAPGARLLGHSGAPGSGTTLLRLIRAAPVPVAAGPPARVLSVDDFAFRRGRRYGSILVDLERHRVVDLLPDRQAATFAAWLGARPPPRVVSRDRGGEYARGGREGAPGAVQVADRFHLLRNVADAVGRVLRRHAALLRGVPAPPPRAAGPAPLPQVRLTRPDRAASRERTRQALRARFEAVRELTARGVNHSAAARALGLRRQTVQRYARLAAPPERRCACRRTSALAPHAGYLLERWQQGQRQALALWRELQARGYPGGYQQVARFVADLRARARAGDPLPPPPPALTPRQAVGLLLTRPAGRTPEERLAVERLQALHPELRTAVGLLDGFAQLLRARSAVPPAQRRPHLEQWMTAATASGVPEFAAFVGKLRKDLEAVAAALVLPYSQGQTEGQVNRLKTLKRAMYGRAKFDLLRQRVLYAAA